VEIPTGHYFHNKYVSFCGNMVINTRRDLSDRLFFDCGGVPLERLAAWTNYLVIGSRGEMSATYKEAQHSYDRGSIIFLTEQEFIDTMDGKYVPPENPNKNNHKNRTVWPPNDPDWERKEEIERLDFMDGKREDYLAKRKPAGNKYDVRLQTDMKLGFTSNQVNMMWEALDLWGQQAQANQTIEECAELIVALQKHLNRTPSPDSLDNVIDEITDVEVLLAQMRLTFGISDEMLNKRIAKKFTKLKGYLARDHV